MQFGKAESGMPVEAKCVSLVDGWIHGVDLREVSSSAAKGNTFHNHGGLGARLQIEIYLQLVIPFKSKQPYWLQLR